MIYLFSNHSYGAPFVVAAAHYAQRTGVEITRVAPAPSSRGRRNGAAALRSIATRLLRPAPDGLPELVVDDVNAPEFVASLSRFDDGIIAGFDQIFQPPAIARFSNFVNVHPSLLPYYRGPEPAYWCLQEGEIATGFTIHRVTERIDDGPILYQEMVEMQPGDRATSLSQRIAHAAVPVFERWLEHLSTGAPWQTVTVDAAAVYRRHVDYRSFRPSRPTIS